MYILVFIVEYKESSWILPLIHDMGEEIPLRVVS